jgi:hypothetical protein
VVVLRRVGDAETDRDLIEEFLFAEIVADVKDEFVVAGWGVGQKFGAAIGVGANGFEELAGDVEFDLQVRGGATVLGIEDVGA